MNELNCYFGKHKFVRRLYLELETEHSTKDYVYAFRSCKYCKLLDERDEGIKVKITW